MPLSAILFDAVGTLWQPAEPVAVTYQRFAALAGSQLTAESIAASFKSAVSKHLAERDLTSVVPITSEATERIRWQSLVAEVISDVPPLSAAGQLLFENLWHYFSLGSSWRLMPDAVTTLQTLTARGFVVGIASNFDQRLLRIVRESPLANWVPAERIFVSSQVGFPKPHPAYFRAIEQQLGLPAGQLLLVGDDPYCDGEGARTAGWRVLLVAPNADETERIFSLAAVVEAVACLS